MKEDRHLLSSIYPQIVVVFMTYVDEHITCSLRAKQIAEDLEVPYKYLSAMVNQNLNRTIPSYIRQRRVECAAKLLIHTDLPIEKISADFQFKRQQYFATAFRQRFQCSPTQYRQKQWGTGQGIFYQ
ncbi:helix-turn-helix transcriptional regulator [Marinococcus halotolerans]|uniref:helix-turn-helix transcriptional regulator n=1 Tax=Marinococcus halotolerans TaxID=301092 RepID=UPI0003B58E0B|nr:AraC family transcriptional regulator [Marinococcus halotolerans]